MLRAQANRSIGLAGGAGSSARRFHGGLGGARAVFFAVGVVLVLLVILDVPALAIETHPFTGVSIGPEGKSSSTDFEYLQSVAVDPATGDLYAWDPGKGRLYKFNAQGEPVDFAATGTNYIESEAGSELSRTANQVAVAPPDAIGGTAGDIYITGGLEVRVYSVAGDEIGHIATNEPLCGVATDSTGDVFTKSRELGSSYLSKFVPTSNPVTNADAVETSVLSVAETCNIAVDGNGHFFVAGWQSYSGNEPVPGLVELSSLAATSARQVDPSAETVAVEPGTNDFYASRGDEVLQYAEDDSLLATFGEDRLLEAQGLSVASSGGVVYVADRHGGHSGRVDVFGPMTSLPDAVAGVASGVGRTSAVLNGTVDADGAPAVTTCRFEYTPQAAYEVDRFEGAASAACAPAGPFTGNAAESVSAEVSGLVPGTTYRFRLVAGNEHGSLGSDENGSSPGKVPSFEAQPALTVKTESPTGVGTSAVTFAGSVNPEGDDVSECFFEYGPTTTYGSTVPCEAPGAGEIGTGDQPVAVHGHVEGLTSNTKYDVRLVGKSSDFGGVLVPGGNISFESHGPPRILSEGFSGVGSATATISGSIDPDGEATTYVVEYVTDTAFQESEFATAIKVPAGGGEVIGSGQQPVAVSQELTGLLPNTTYHFRISTSNGAGSVTGPKKVFTTYVTAPVFGPCLEDEPFRVGPGAALPDCRAYEQASSPEKNGDSVASLLPMMFAAEDGSGVTFYSPAAALPPASSGGAQNFAAYLATRDSTIGDWSSQRLLPPESYGDEAEFLGATPDLHYAVVSAGSHSTNEFGLFLLDTEDGAVTQIAPHVRSGPHNSFGVDGIVAGGSRVFFESEEPVPTVPADPAPVAGHINLYMWERATGEVSLVGVLPAGEGGAAPPEGSFGGAYEWYEEQALGRGGALNKTSSGDQAPVAIAAVHAISSTGDQMFFTAAGTGQLYLRRGLGTATPSTLRISTPNAGASDPNGSRPAAFQEAVPDGSRAFFLSSQKLTTTATTGAGDGGRDLYEWQASTESLVDIAPDHRDENGAEVQGLIGVSASGDSGYFVARGVLATGAKSGSENLYRFVEEPGGQFDIKLVAVLATGSGSQESDRRNVSPLVSFVYPLDKTARVSENGETLIFESAQSLAGYDNVNPEGINCVGGKCPELYRYSAQAEEVICVSCNPTGAPPKGAASLDSEFFNVFLYPYLPPAASLGRNLSADGSRVFFQTPDPLVATDTNGNASCPASGKVESGNLITGTGACQDVYEWEAVGSGSCTAVEADGGCLYLLSTGQSDRPSYFVGASTDGSNVFIATNSQLVPSDRDHADDVYDVRIGGGLASQYATATPPCNSTEGCRGAVSSTPASMPSLGSSVFSGPGDILQSPPQSAPAPGARGKPRTRAQLLAKALEACHSKRDRGKRHSCERQARKRYAPQSRKSPKRRTK